MATMTGQSEAHGLRVAGLDADGNTEDVNATNRALHVIQVDATGTAISLSGVTSSLPSSPFDITAVSSDLDIIDTSDFSSLTLDVVWTGDAAAVVDEFDIAISTTSADHRIIYTTAGDYTSPAGLLIGTWSSDGTGNLTAIPDGGWGGFTMDVMGINSVLVSMASSGTGSAAVTYSGR